MLSHIKTGATDVADALFCATITLLSLPVIALSIWAEHEIYGDEGFDG